MRRIFTTLINIALLLGCCAALTPAAMALSVPTERHLIAPPAHLITAPNLHRDDQPIQLKSLRLSGEISGGLAQTTVEMVFFNPNGRNLEGQLQFPLLEGQQISAFALDIDGKLRPAVPVTKAKGQQIFEEVERARVDPGLLEATQGNNFRLRIYPIPPHGSRTVQIKYTEALTRQGTQWAYRMPLAYGERWAEFRLDLALHDIDAAPKAGGALSNVRFTKKGRQYQAHLTKFHFNAKGELNLLIPASAQAQIFTQTKDDESWFLAEIPVSNVQTARVLPKRIGLLWDASNSGAKRDHEAEFAELARYFKAVGNADVLLTFLRDKATDGGVFKIINGNWIILQQALQKTVYDGASALGDWTPVGAIKEYLLVSDGLTNYGTNYSTNPFPTLAQGQRLYALNSAQAADSVRLSSWAGQSGGKLAQINPQKPGAAAAMLLTEGVHLHQLSATGARDLQVESHEAQNGLLRVTGRLTGNEAQVNLLLSKNGKRENLKLNINRQKTAPHPFAANLWAAYKLRALEADYEIHRAEISRIGQQFGLTTRETSLIVLETMDDYVRYDIPPPADYLAAYEQLKQSGSVRKNQEHVKHMDSVVRLFNAKIAWWEKDFPKDDLIAKRKKEAERIAAERAEAARIAAQAAAGQERDARKDIKKSKSALADETRSVREVATTAAEPQPMAALSAPMAMAPPPAPASVATAKPSGLGDATQEIGISLKKWTANAPYIARLKAATADKIYAIYLDEKPGFINSSAFYLDAADMLQEKGKAELAMRVLSNIAELDLENRALLRILGYRLLQAGAPKLAIPIFEKIVRLAPEEPQSYRDLGLAYAADLQYQKAIDQFNEVVERTWDGRFPEIETIVLAEMNAIISTANEKSGEKSAAKLDLSRIDPRLIKSMPLDLRVIMTWDADNADMDLWLTDPNGERCYYGHALTYQGGRMSRDFILGYGPEEFSLRKAIPGKYKIEANFYGNRQQVIAGATTVQVKVSAHFGTAQLKEQHITLRLQERKDTVFVGEFEVKP